jgi:TolB protein
VLSAVAATLTGAGRAGGQGPIIDIEKEADRRISIGIGKYPEIPAKELGSPPGNVVAFDFELSGWFQPIRPAMLPPKSLNDWERRGAEVIAELDMIGEDLRGWIRDVGTGDVLFEREYAPGIGPLRQRLHRFCDDVVKALTGERGSAETKILCEWDPGDGKRIVIMDIDGFGLRELSGEIVLELSPRWSVDGSQAVYTSYASGYPDVYVHDLRVGSRERVAHYEGLNAHGHLHPTQDRIVLTLSQSGNPEIYSKELDSGKIWRLTNHRATDTSPVWSPEGERIAFVSDRPGSPQIYVMNADSSDLNRVTFRGNYNTAPDWSPDGKRIAYCALRPDGYQIQVVELETGNVMTVTEGGGCEDPSWSPDGRSILYSRKAGGRTDLYISNLSERRALRVSRGSGRYTGPAWSPFLDSRE